MTEVYFIRDGHKFPVAVLKEGWCPDHVEISNPAGCVHSDEFVTMFLGFLAAKGAYRDDIKPSELLDLWATYKREMGK